VFHLQRAKNDKIDAGLIGRLYRCCEEDPCATGSSPGAVCRGRDLD